MHPNSQTKNPTVWSSFCRSSFCILIRRNKAAAIITNGIRIYLRRNVIPQKTQLSKKYSIKKYPPFFGGYYYLSETLTTSLPL